VPEFATTHVDSLLTGISIKYPLGLGQVATTILPQVIVGKESGIYFKYNKGDMARVPFTKRQLRSESRQVTWRVSTDSYRCEEYALSDLIDEREYQQADAPLDLQRDTLENLQNLLILDRERRVHTLVTDAAVITKNDTLTGTAQWRDAGGSGTTAVPLFDFETGSEAIRQDTGVRPNLAIFGMAAWLAFNKATQILDRIITPGGSWGSPTITVDVARTLLAPYGITSVIVTDTVQNTGNLGAADSFADIWADEVLLAYVTPSPGIKKVSFGYTFLSRGWQVRREVITKQHSDWIEPSYVADEKLVAPDVAYLILDVSDGS
jgi:hypothetical protein